MTLKAVLNMAEGAMLFAHLKQYKIKDNTRFRRTAS